MNDADVELGRALRTFLGDRRAEELFVLAYELQRKHRFNTDELTYLFLGIRSVATVVAWEEGCVALGGEEFVQECLESAQQTRARRKSA